MGGAEGRKEKEEENKINVAKYRKLGNPSREHMGVICSTLKHFYKSKNTPTLKKERVL